jgi:SNF2 family DNA or RNA helicase
VINIAYTDKLINPYKHQIEAFTFIKYKPAFALFMEQGTGKSKVTLMKTDYLYEKGMIDSMILITPNSIKEQWVLEEFPKHYCKPFAYIIWNRFTTNKSRNEFYDVLSHDNMLRVFVINIEAFQSNKIDDFLTLFCKAVKEPLIVIDESTRIKNPDKIRTKRILTGFKNRKYKAILTGTPTPKSPFDLYSQFEFLQDKFFGGLTYFHFKHHHGIMIKNTNSRTEEEKSYFKPLDEKGYNKIKNFLNKRQPLNQHTLLEASIKYNTSVKNIMYINNMNVYTGYKNMDKLNQKISTITFKVMKKDCLDLPDKIYMVLHADLTNEQKKLYTRLKKEYLAEYKSKELTVTNKMVMTMRLQMIAGGVFPYNELLIKKILDKNHNEVEVLKPGFKYSNILPNGKLEVLLDDLNNSDIENKQIIIWSVFVGEIKMITNTLKEKGYSVESYYGGIPMYERKNLLDKFKKGEIQILVINSVIGGEGLNLQNSTLHYFYSNGYMSDKRLQAEDRSHRIGQKNNVIYKDIICRNTVDDKVLKILRQGINLIDYFRNSSIEEIVY